MFVSVQDVQIRFDVGKVHRHCGMFGCMSNNAQSHRLHCLPIEVRKSHVRLPLASIHLAATARRLANDFDRRVTKVAAGPLN